MFPIAENLSDYIVSSFEIRQYSCIPRLHKRKNFLAMGRRFCKKTVLLSGAAPDRRILSYCERRATMPITAPFLQKSIVPDCIVYPTFFLVAFCSSETTLSTVISPETSLFMHWFMVASTLPQVVEPFEIRVTSDEFIISFTCFADSVRLAFETSVRVALGTAQSSANLAATLSV